MKYFLTFILFICPFISYANDVGYEVEVILFEDLSSKYSNSEKWLTTEDMLLTETQSGESTDNKEIPTENSDPVFQKLTLENSRLSKQLEKLQNRSDYQILVHEIWKQTGLDAKKAFPIAIDSEKANTAASTTTESLESASSSLSGTITLIMSRYLHINANLVYRKPLPLDNEDNDHSQSGNLYENYPVTFERRMRSKEIHYIDHPFIGMIILAVPFQIETQPADESETASDT